MNSLFEKLDNFFAEREPKEKYMLYIALVIIFGLIYYYFNYNYLYKRVEEKRDEIFSLQQSYDVSKYVSKLNKLKLEYKKISKNIEKIKKELKKIESLMEKSKKPDFFVNTDEVLDFLKNMFSFSIKNHLFPSYYIDINNSNLAKYSIFLKGSTPIPNFNSFIKMLRFSEKENNFIYDIERVEFNITYYNTGIVSDYNATLKIWSYK